MNRKLTQHNLELLNIVATRFDELCHEITFVGGCVLGLLVTDRAAPDVRFTVDVDCIILEARKQIVQERMQAIIYLGRKVATHQAYAVNRNTWIYAF